MAVGCTLTEEPLEPKTKPNPPHRNQKTSSVPVLPLATIQVRQQRPLGAHKCQHMVSRQERFLKVEERINE